jgi:hypothetical protein
MLLLLSLVAAAPDPAQSIADPAERRVVQSCETSLSRKAGGEISSIDVDAVRRSGRTMTVKGTLRVLQKPPTRPGEMTPTHVIAAHYSFECRSTGRAAPRIKLHALDH